VRRIEFERVTPESVGIPSAAIENLLDKLESADYCEPHGLMIMRHGKICAEGWWAPYAQGVPHTLFSLTKTYTATAVGIAYTEGLLDLDDRIIDYFPEYRSVGDERNKKITIRHALAMASGKPEYRCYNKEWRRHFFEIPFTAEPGAKFEYSCEDTRILMGVVQKATGEDLSEYLRSRLFEKIGINTDNIKWLTLPDGSVMAEGGLFATTEDSLRLIKLYLDGGVWEGERILARDYIDQATTKQIDNWGHGYGFQIHMGSLKSSYHGSGLLGQAAIAVPDLDMAVAFYQSGIHISPEDLSPDSTRFKIKSAQYYFEAVGDIFNILFPAAKEDRLPEDVRASGSLARRMSALSLPNPVSRPLPEMASKVSGKRYEIKKGTFMIRRQSRKLMLVRNYEKPRPLPEDTGMDWFSFEFDRPDTCKLRFQEGGREFALDIGLDGLRRLNSYNLEETLNYKVVLDGVWTGEDTFSLSARWIETGYSITVSFKFTDKGSEISLESVRGDHKWHPLRKGNALAELKP
jgi:CubicO group peptidase (beta-lactamase class C family)